MGQIASPLLAPLLDALREEPVDRTTYPAGGPVAAVVAGLSASLLAAAADASRDQWAEAAGARAQALALRDRAAELAERDAAAYSRAREALATGGDDEQLGHALRDAADPLLELAAAAADIAQLAVSVSRGGAGDVRPDAVVAASLAAAAAAAAARLAQVNLAVGGEHMLATEAKRYAERAANAAATAGDATV